MRWQGKAASKKEDETTAGAGAVGEKRIWGMVTLVRALSCHHIYTTH